MGLRFRAWPFSVSHSFTQQCSIDKVMPGYFKNAEATASTLIDRWCHTGDIGYYNEVSKRYSQKKYNIAVKKTSCCNLTYMKLDII